MINYIIKYTTFFLLFFHLLAYSKKYHFTSSDIKNIPARDIYGVLDKIATLHGLSYGHTGQVSQIRSLGKDLLTTIIYIDDVPVSNFNSGLINLSSLSLDRIDNIVIDDSPAGSSSLAIYICTKKYDTTVPVTEMVYRDAFYNHRNISMHLGQNFNEDTSFLLYAEITDYRDHRESSDNFKYPYQKQNYNLQINLPSIFFFKPVFEASYLKEDIFDLSLDSAQYKPEETRFLLKLNSDSGADNKYVNTLSFINSHRNDHFDHDNRNFRIYDRFSYDDSKNSFLLNSQLDHYSYRDLRGETSFSLEPSYQRTFSSFSAYFKTFFLYSDFSRESFSADIELDQNLPLGFEITSEHSIFKGNYRILDSVIESEYFQNEIYLGNNFNLPGISVSINSGIDIIEYQKNISKTFSGYLAKGVNRFSKSKLDLQIFSDLKLKIYFSHKFNSDMILNDPNSTVVTSLNFTKKYFKDNLDISTTVLHKYSDFYIDYNNRQIINNLGFNLRVKIIDLELFFGIDNIMKNKYDINNTTYILNEHYGYQTIQGYDMQRFDEIWGVRWIFRY